MAREKIFTISVMSDLGDSVVQTGSVPTLVTRYFNTYAAALEYLRDEFKKFIDEGD